MTGAIAGYPLYAYLKRRMCQRYAPARAIIYVGANLKVSLWLRGRTALA